MGNSFFNEYPYTDFHELNLSWVIKELRSFATTLEQFVSINALKYADPIQWNITSQYEKNTIVIDPQSGTAYISVQTVPAGVALTDTNYWSVVFDLEQFVTKANNNFTLNVEPTTTLNATFSTAKDSWVVWGGILYKALVNITAGDQYVVDSNIKRITVEDITGHTDALITTDKSNLVAAINEINGIITTLTSNVGDLADLITTDKSSIVNAINEEITTRSNDVITLNNHIDNISQVLNLYNTYADLVSDVDNLNDGDIVSTKGFSDIGVGAGVYKIHNNSEAYYLPCGTKYAELIYDNDVIDIECFGPSHDILELTNVNDDIIDIIINLAFHNKPVINMTYGYDQGGAVIKFGPYNYRFRRAISSVFNGFGAITFEGCDHNSVIAFDGPSYWLSVAARTDNTFNDNIHFKNLVFMGSGSMISLEKASFSSFEDCLFLNTTGVGVFLQSSVGIDFNRCAFTGPSVGVVVQNICTTVNFSSCGFRQCGIGIQILSGCNGIIIRDSIVEYNTSHGFYIESSTDISLQDLWIEGNTNIISATSVFCRNVKTHVGVNSEPCTVTVNNITANKYNLDIAGVTRDFNIAAPLTVAQFSGIVRYDDGYTIDFSTRKVIIPKSIYGAIGQFDSAANGFVNVCSSGGTYTGSYSFQNGVALAFTKIGGSLTGPDIAQTDGTFGFSTLPAASTTIEFTF